MQKLGSRLDKTVELDSLYDKQGIDEIVNPKISLSNNTFVTPGSENNHFL